MADLLLSGGTNYAYASANVLSMLSASETLSSAGLASTFCEADKHQGALLTISVK